MEHTNFLDMLIDYSHFSIEHLGSENDIPMLENAFDEVCHIVNSSNTVKKWNMDFQPVSFSHNKVEDIYVSSIRFKAIYKESTFIVDTFYNESEGSIQNLIGINDIYTVNPDYTNEFTTLINDSELQELLVKGI